MQYKAVGKNVYYKKDKKWELKTKTMTRQKAKLMVERLEMEQSEWRPITIYQQKKK